jgi:ribosomal protein S18 acetylase RimI-like enzyme
VRVVATKIGHSIRRADPADVPAVTAVVHAAYGHYPQRIGFRPRPMTDDYAEVVRSKSVSVLVMQRAVVGVVVLDIDIEGFVVDNVALNPSFRGKGLGKVLLEFAEAEARREGFDSICLCTHEKMTENLALYARIGYVEYDRRSRGAFSLVYMRKPLG